MDNNLNLLYLEDDLNDIKTFEDTIKRYNVENEKNVSYSICNTLEEAKTQLLDRNVVFDAVIIDIKLNNEPGKGNEAANIIESFLLRIPCVAFTGTPDDVNSDLIIEKFTKATSSIEDVLNYLYDIKKTGLINILGSNGQLEKYLSQIYNNNIKFNINSWLANGIKNSDLTEKSLLRHISYCVIELINKDFEYSLPEEIYISPLISNNITTGSILKSRDSSNQFFIVLSPECDLVVRQGTGKPKTDFVLLCQIDSLKLHERLKDISKESKEKYNEIKKYVTNNSGGALHFLPKTNILDDSLINFRKVLTVPYEKINSSFELICKIAYPYTKDIVSRFSAYYSRQGQPDFNFEDITENIMQELIKANTRS